MTPELESGLAIRGLSSDLCVQLHLFLVRLPRSSSAFRLRISLPGPDYFDEEAKCYSRLFEFCQVTFCSGVA